MENKDDNSKNVNTGYTESHSSSYKSTDSIGDLETEAIRKTNRNPDINFLSKEAQDAIGRYGRMRFFILALIIVGGIFMTGAVVFLVIRGSTPIYTLLPPNKNLQNLIATSSNGKTVVIAAAAKNDSAKYDNYIYTSIDSGVHFDIGCKVEGAKFPLTKLSVSPNGKAIFVQSQNFEMYLKGSNNDTFRLLTLNSSHSAKGICFQPNTSNAFIYGDSGVLKLDYRDGGLLGEDHTDTLHFISMAFDSLGKNALAIGQEIDTVAVYLGGGIDIYGHQYASVNRRFDILQTVLLKSTDGLKFSKTKRADDADKAVGSSDKNYKAVFPCQEIGGWSIVFESLDSKSLIEYYSSDLNKQPYAIDQSHFKEVVANERLLAFWGSDSNTISYHKFILKPDYYSRDTLGFASNIYSLALSDSGLAYAIVKNNGQLYLAAKGKNAWSPIPILTSVKTANHLIWVYIFFILSIVSWIGAGVGLNINREIYDRAQNTFNKKSAENELVPKTDQPIGLDDDDLLGFTVLEDATVRILKNPDTVMPLTIVISGGWGSGKSSMMNRIREKLKEGENEKLFLTAWFNAWHQQSEENMLNIFLLNIIDCYEKYFTLPFRFRLIRNRLMELSYLRQFGFWFAMGVIVPFFLLVVSRLLFRDFAHNNHFMTDYFDALAQIVSSGFLNKETSKIELPALLTKLGAGGIILSGLFFLRKEWMPSGLSSLIELIPMDKFKLKAKEQSPTFRGQFKKEYWDIIKAGDKSKRIVVFIDDVDRIPGDKILELLNAINFISDTASQPDDGSKEPSNVVFVLGMYTQEVVKNLGVKLKAINGSDMNSESIGANYIEKMVDLIITVPFDEKDTDKLKGLFMRNM